MVSPTTVAPTPVAQPRTSVVAGASASRQLTSSLRVPDGSAPRASFVVGQNPAPAVAAAGARVSVVGMPDGTSVSAPARVSVVGMPDGTQGSAPARVSVVAMPEGTQGSSPARVSVVAAQDASGSQNPTFPTGGQSRRSVVAVVGAAPSDAGKIQDKRRSVVRFQEVVAAATAAPTYLPIDQLQQRGPAEDATPDARLRRFKTLGPQAMESLLSQNPLTLSQPAASGADSPSTSDSSDDDEPVPEPMPRRKFGRAKTITALPSVKVGVVAPGGGTGINAAAYQALQAQGFTVEILGASRTPYDRYPPGFQDGCPPPNLESFGKDLVSQGKVESCEAFIVGSRGGQVVLPVFWKLRGNQVPPTVVINGGCSMNLPTPSGWPDQAVSFLLLGGQDYFKNNQSTDDYFAQTCGNVNPKNSTTAVLYVEEMGHMPQVQLLTSILEHMLLAIVRWKSFGAVPTAKFEHILTILSKGGFSGRFAYTKSAGAWGQLAFSPSGVTK